MSASYPPERVSGEIDRRIAQLVANRYGVFSRDEAMRLGATRYVIEWRLRTGRWVRLSSGIYRVAGAPASWRQTVFAEVLGWGDDAAASYRSAASLWTLAGCASEKVELTVVGRQRRTSSRAIIHRERSMPGMDRTVVAAIPVTAPARTLIDIAAVLDTATVEEALDDALRRRLVSLSRLRWRVEELAGRGRPGSAVIRRLIAARTDATEVPQSVLETRLLRLVRGAGLPRPVVQQEVRDKGRVVAVVDLAYPDRRLAIEADGYRWHSSRRRWEHDLERRNALTALGWSVVHVTWEQLTRRPDDVVGRIRMALGV